MLRQNRKSTSVFWAKSIICIWILAFLLGCSGNGITQLDDSTAYFSVPDTATKVAADTAQETLERISDSSEIALSLNSSESNHAVFAILNRISLVRPCVYIELLNGEYLYLGFPLMDNNARHPWHKDTLKYPENNSPNVREVLIDQNATYLVDERALDYTAMEAWVIKERQECSRLAVLVRVSKTGSWMPVNRFLELLHKQKVHRFEIRFH